MIYLDNAATSWPKPEVVYVEMDRFFRTSAANPGRSGHHMAVATEQAIQRARLSVARLFNGPDPSRLVFAFNITDALNTAMKGLLRPGDHVITSSMEHNSVVRPLKALESRGISTTKVPCSPEGWLDPDDVQKAITGSTRMIVTTHVSNVTGTIQPVEEIGRIARQHNLLYLVDGAQSAGALPVDLSSLPIDLFGFTGHKGLFGPPGTGGVYIGDRVDLSQFGTIREGGTGSRSEEAVQPPELPQRFESGTPNTVGLVGLGAGVDYLHSATVAAVRAHEVKLTGHLWDGLSEIKGLRLYGPPEETHRGAVLSFTAEGWEPADLGAVLDQSFQVACRTGLHCAPDAIKTIGAFPKGTIRLSPGYFNTIEEIDQVIGYIGQIVSSTMA